MIVLGFIIDYLIFSTLLSPLATPTEFTQPPDDFPVLAVTVHMDRRDLAEQWCPGMFNLRGCAYVNFRTMTCDIAIVDNSEANLREELSHGHCEGRDHKGESTISDAWKSWRDSQRLAQVTP